MPTTKKKVRVRSIGLMVGNILAGGRMESSMERECTLQATAKKRQAVGTMVKKFKQVKERAKGEDLKIK